MQQEIIVARRYLLLLSLFLSLFLFVQDASARLTNLTPMRMVSDPGDVISIKGYRGQIEYIANEKSNDIVIEVKETADEKWSYLDDWQLTFRREGKVIFVHIEGPTDKSHWNEVQMSGQIPQFQIRLVGPSRNLEIFWQQGRIVVGSLMANLFVTAVQADVVASQIQGQTTIFNQSGQIQVRDIKGNVDIDSYNARVDIQRVDGRLQVLNFSGETKIQRCEGGVLMTSYSGASRLQQVKGKLDFNNGQSPIHIEKFEGELRGQNKMGPVYAEISGEADVRIDSGDGLVQLKMPTSGAWVNVATEEGALQVPSFLKLTRTMNQQIRSGRLRGGSTGGQVHVRTSKGDIRIR